MKNRIVGKSHKQRSTKIEKRRSENVSKKRGTGVRMDGNTQVFYESFLIPTF